MKSPAQNRINQNKHLQKPLDCPSVWFGDFSDTPWALAFYVNRRSRQMKKEITIKIVIDVSEEMEKQLEDIRWKHIDVDRMIKEMAGEQLKDIITSVIEEACHE